MELKDLLFFNNIIKRQCNIDFERDELRNYETFCGKITQPFVTVIFFNLSLLFSKNSF